MPHTAIAAVQTGLVSRIQRTLRARTATLTLFLLTTCSHLGDFPAVQGRNPMSHRCNWAHSVLREYAHSAAQAWHMHATARPRRDPTQQTHQGLLALSRALAWLSAQSTGTTREGGLACLALTMTETQ